MSWRLVITLLLAAAGSGHLLTAPLASQGTDSNPARRSLTYEDARAVVDLLNAKLPPTLARETATGRAAAWPAWLDEHRTRQQERLDRGDEDSLVNLWLFGTSFTRLPPARPRDVPGDDTRALGEIADQRLDDLFAASRRSPNDERLGFVLETLRRRGMDLDTRPGRDAARTLLIRARDRARAEFARTDRLLLDARRGDNAAAELEAHSTIFRDRGLSSDTSMLVDHALEMALTALRAGGIVRAGGIRRVAIVGPGLDFINKADGLDFYPQQSIQPFAVIDSLLRLGLSQPETLRVTTFDLNPRVNHHLVTARARAQAGEGYLLHLPLPRGERWTPEVRGYWQRMGDQIGAPVPAARLPEGENAEIRAIRVAPSFVLAVTPQALDIVAERLVLEEAERFDLVVGTNVFVYYGPFEQGLAAANIAAMLRSGGVLLSNNDVPTPPPMKPAVGYLPVTYSDRQNDHVFSYQRQ